LAWFAQNAGRIAAFSLGFFLLFPPFYRLFTPLYVDISGPLCKQDPVESGPELVDREVFSLKNSFLPSTTFCLLGES